MGFKNPEDAAIAACVSLLLEVSGNPKAGNVDRDHNFEDLRYEHFLISAAAAMPSFLKATSGKIGRSIYEAVEKSMEWHTAENVHFGAFLLLVPLLSTWKEHSKESAAERAVENLKKTDAEDSVFILKAFKLSRARVMETEKLTLRNERTEELLWRENINVYEWMKLAPRENLIAQELVGGYPISLGGSEFLLNSVMDVNDSIVFLYHKLLSEYPDPLIIAKSGFKTAKEVTEMAKKALESEKPIDEFKKLDEYLLKNKLNPGTIADLVSSSIYLALHEGWRI